MQSNNYFRSESEREQHNYLDCDGSGWKFNGWGWGGCSVCCTRKQIVWNFRINVRLSQLSCPSDFVAVNRICRGRLKGRSSCQANNTWFVPPFASGWKERGCLRYNTVDCENTRAWCFWWMIRWLHLNKYPSHAPLWHTKQWCWGVAIANIGLIKRIDCVIMGVIMIILIQSLCCSADSLEFTQE